MKINGKFRCSACMREIESENGVCVCGCQNGTVANPVHSLPIGTVLANEYYVGKVIGEGGFGITYVGWDTNLDIKVAIKEFFPNGFSTRNTTISTDVNAGAASEDNYFEKHRDKFVNEAKVLASFFNEPGIVTVFRYLRENNTVYIIMEFIEGETLKDYLAKRGRLTVDETVGIMGPIMNSLAKVHDKQLIHRDISPDNIMITTYGQGKLIDFGAAKDVTGDNKSVSVVIKHGYAPVEQYQTHGQQGTWTDVYALSATIYRCITGMVPVEAVERLSGDAIKTPHELVAECSPKVSDVIMKGLSISKDDRYQTVGEMKNAFMAALNDSYAAGTMPVGQQPGNQMGMQPNGQMSNNQMGMQPNGQMPNNQMGMQPNGQMINNQMGMQPNGQVINNQMGVQPNNQMINNQMGMWPGGQVQENQKIKDKKAPDNNARGKSKKKKWLMPAVVGAVILVLLGAGGFVFFDYTNAYNKALEYAESGDFVKANEELKYKQIVEVIDEDFGKYIEAGVLYNMGNFSGARDEFAKLGDYKDSNKYYQDCEMHIAIGEYENELLNGSLEEAYAKLVKIDFSDSAKKNELYGKYLDECIKRLKAGEINYIATLNKIDEVASKGIECSKYNSQVYDTFAANIESLYSTTSGQNTICLTLDELEERGGFDITPEMELYGALSGRGTHDEQLRIYKANASNELASEKLLTKEFAYEFFLGKWKDSSNHYFELYRRGSDGYTISYNIPHIDGGTFEFNDSGYILFDGSKKAFYFTIFDTNKMSVYSYGDGRTYNMNRAY